MAFEKPELFQLLKIAEKAVSVADEILLQHFGLVSTVEHKDRAGLVTNADREAEEAITEIFRSETPDIEVVGEEAAYFDEGLVGRSSGRPRWVIDPLDGTTNYVHGLPIFCVSIGLEVHDQTVVGAVSVPRLDQLFTAVRGGGANCNGDPLQVSGSSRLEDSLLATGFSVSKPELLQTQLGYFDTIIAKSRGIRRAGSAAYDLAMVACGTFDAYWESHLSPWDTSAGYLLVQEAGGKVSQYNGDDYKSSCEQVLASNGKIHDDLVQALSTGK